MHLKNGSGLVPSVLIAAFIVSDFSFISQLLEYYFVDAVWRGWLASGVLALLADITPTILAACIMIQNKKKIHYVGIDALTTMLAALFAFLGYVRLNSADLIFSLSSTSLVSVVNQTAETSLSAAQIGMSWLFVILPIATSILSFIIAAVSDGKAKREYSERVAGANWYDHISMLEAEKIEIEDLISSDFESYVDELKQLALSDNNAEKAIIKNKMKLLQAMAAGKPQAASEIFKRVG